MKILLTQLATYHLWANQLLIDRILQLPQELQQKELPGSFPALSKTLLHMLDAESIWWQRMKLQEHVVRPGDHFTGSCADVAKALIQQSKQWQEWVLAAQPHMLDHEFIYRNNRKETFKQPVFQVLVHIFNHGTYHRGQLVSMLRQLQAGNIPATDFIVWSRKGKN
jgi:uncharacterized damage-inducible protein DinB